MIVFLLSWKLLVVFQNNRWRGGGGGVASLPEMHSNFAYTDCLNTLNQCSRDSGGGGGSIDGETRKKAHVSLGGSHLWESLQISTQSHVEVP